MIRQKISLEVKRRARTLKIGDRVVRGDTHGEIIGSMRFGDWLVRWQNGRESGCYEHDLKLDGLYIEQPKQLTDGTIDGEFEMVPNG